MVKFKRFGIKHAIISVLSILFIVVVFLSNKTLIFLFEDKIWAHKVNSIEKLNEATNIFSGVELDVVFYIDGNYFDVNHPPDKSINLSLNEYFQSQMSDPDYRYWIDFKNLNKDNKLQSSNSLDSITKLFKIDKSNIIVESVAPQFLKSFRDKGFITSYYLPPGIHTLNEESLETILEKIRNNIIFYENIYISCDYKDYPIVKKHFPDTRKITWFTVYGYMNKIKAILLLYEILLDENVDVLLISFHSTNEKI